MILHEITHTFVVLYHNIFVQTCSAVLLHANKMYSYEKSQQKWARLTEASFTLTHGSDWTALPFILVLFVEK